jgi:predicted lipoprotein with Yx(FWY)xxD motif
MNMKHASIIVAGLAAALAVAVGSVSAATHAPGRSATVGTAASPLGRILVDSGGRTLYLFEKDTKGHSTCSGACAGYWPPLLTTAEPSARGAVKQSLLGVTRRADGTRQVTYAGHPLYRFVQDTKRGQTNGQGLKLSGAEWYVLSPAGTKIDRGNGAAASGY